MRVSGLGREDRSSDQQSLPRFGRRRHVQLHVPSEILRERVELRVERVLPSHLLARVGGHATHGRQRLDLAGELLPVADGVADLGVREAHRGGAFR